MIVDASVWVSSLIVEDRHHQESKRWLVRQIERGETPFVPTLALPEVAGAIARRTGSAELGREAARRMRRTPGLRLVALDGDLAAEAADLAADARLRGADAVYVAAARALNLPLFTWDQDLAERAGRFVQVVHP
jgi:predicted nucleic acid-binding protein